MAGQRVTFRLDCGAGIGSPGMWLTIKVAGRTVRMVAYIDAWIHQVVQTVVDSLKPADLTINSTLYDDDGSPYFLKISGTPAIIRELIHDLWKHVRPNGPDRSSTLEGSGERIDTAIGMRTVLVYEGMLVIRTYMVDPADDKVGLPTAAIEYLRQRGLAV